MGPRADWSPKGEISPKVLPVTHVGPGIPQMDVSLTPTDGAPGSLLTKLERERHERLQIAARLESLAVSSSPGPGTLANGGGGRHNVGERARHQTLGHDVPRAGQAPVSPLVLPRSDLQPFPSQSIAPLGQQASAARPAAHVNMRLDFGAVDAANNANGRPPSSSWENTRIASSRRTGYVDRNDKDSLIPRALKAVVHRPALPPSITPEGYVSGFPPSGPRNRDEPVQILPFLILGSIKVAQDREALVQMNVSALMNCCSVDYQAPEGCSLASCRLDDADTSLSLQRQKAMDAISSTRQDGGVVLVFQVEDDVSASGPVASWTGAVCIMYLMWECRLTLFRAYALVRFKIPDLKISPRICAYLVHYEAILHGNNSMILKNSLLAEILPTDVVA